MFITRKEQLKFDRSHAFVIGINEYPDLGAKLEGAVNDAVDIAKRLVALQGFDNVLLMKDITGAQLQSLLDWLVDKDRSSALHIPDQGSSEVRWIKLKDDTSAHNIPSGWDNDDHFEFSSGSKEMNYNKDKDAVIFYFAGHGFPGTFHDGPAGYLALSDAKNDLLHKESLIEMDVVYKAVKGFDCRHTLLILDCCFAGKFRFANADRGGRATAVLPMYQQRFNRYIEGKAWQVLVSSGPDQTAMDVKDWSAVRKNSPFASTLKLALEGKADLPGIGISGRLRDGVITASELFLYIESSAHLANIDQKPALFPMKEHGNGEFIFIDPRKLKSQFSFNEDPRNNPYKGLEAFQANQKDINLFFGREEVANEIMTQLFKRKSIRDLQRFLFVSGSSGAGKSSTVQAGVFPKVKWAFQQSREEEMELIIIRPSELVDNNKGKEQFENVFSKLDANNHTLFFIDQYEEIFTLPNADIIEDRVFKLFTKAQQKHRNYILVGLRSDFEWKIRNSSLKKYFQAETIYRLPAMNLDELREALTQPAYWAICDFEAAEKKDGESDFGEGLINQILSDVVNAPGALPMLSFTMNAFYEKAREGQDLNSVYLFTYDIYNAMNGVTGALSSIADDFYTNKLSPLEQEVMKNLLLRMVQLYDSSYNRRKVYYAKSKEGVFSLEEVLSKDTLTEADDYFMDASLSELDLVFDSAPIQSVITKMEASFLIHIDADVELGLPYVEPIHDALILHWDQARVWLDELGKENLVLRNQLWDAVLEAQTILKQERQEANDNIMVAEPQNEDILTSSSPYWDANPKLDAILSLVVTDLKREEKDILNIKEDAPFQLSTSANNFYQALIHFIDQPSLAGQSLTEIFAETSFDAVLEVFTKTKHWINDAELYFLYRSILRKEERFQKLKEERDAAQRTAQRATSNLILNNANLVQNRSASFRLAEMASIIDRNNPKALEQLFKDYYGINNDPAFHYHHVTHLRIDPQQPGFERSFGLAISESGKYYAIGDYKNIRIFNTSDSREIANWEAHNQQVWALCFALGDQFLVSASQDTTMKIWRKPDDHKQERWPLFKTNHDHNRPVTALTVSNDGSKIVSGSFESKSKIRIWENWQNSNATSILVGEQNNGIESLSISPDGEKIMAKSREYKVWQKENEQWISQKVEINSIHGDITFSLDGQSFYAIFGVPQALTTLNRFDFDQEESSLLLDNNIQGFALNHDQTEIVLIDKQGKLLIHEFDPINKTIATLDHEIAIPKSSLLNWVSSEDTRFFLFQQGAEVIFVDRKNQQEQIQAKIDTSTFEIESNNTITPFNLNLSPNKKYLVVSYNGREKLHILNAEDKAIVRTIEHDANIFSFVFSPDDARIYIGDGIGRIHAWSIEDNHPPILVSEEVSLNTSNPINALIFVKETNELILTEDGGDIYFMGSIEIPEDHIINEPLPINQMEEIASNTLFFSFAERTLTLAIVLNESILIWPLSSDMSQTSSTLFDFDGIPGTVQISPSSQYLSYFRKGEIIIHSFNENGEIQENPHFELDTDFSEWTIGKITYNEDESLIFFTTGNSVLAWSLESGKRIFNLNFENKFSAASKGCLLLPNGQNTLENFFPTGSKLILLSSLPSNITKLTELEFSVESLLEASRMDGDIGGLLPEEVAQFEITEYFPNLDILDKQGLLEYADQFKDERSLISFGDYFFERGFNMNFVNQKRNVMQKALRFYEVAAAKGEILTQTTYEIILNDINHILDELP